MGELMDGNLPDCCANYLRFTSREELARCIESLGNLDGLSVDDLLGRQKFLPTIKNFANELFDENITDDYDATRLAIQKRLDTIRAENN